MKVILSKIKSSPTDIVWASTKNISDTLRYKRVISDKAVGTDKIANIRQELIHNRIVSVPLCDKKCAGEEVLSVRTAISGSFKSQAEMVRLINDHIATLTKFVASNENYGFGPGDKFAPELNYPDA